jgi:BirA family biotin operon repressor/biotin-[acetyl-CoA-carboxylase] ligase
MRPTSVPILRLLADGRFHLPDDLARACGASLVKVLDALRELEACGALLQPGAEGAVRLAEPVELLDAPAVQASLRSQQVPVALEVLDVCGSTNAELMARAESGAASGSAIACEVQTAGRGRRGTAWITPPGGALAFSLLWRMPQSGGALAGLSLAAGVACKRALDACGVPGAELKWPNDLLHDGRKLGGILVETAPARAGAAVVCGVGLNTRLNDAALGAIPQPATDVAALCTRPPSRTVLLGKLLAELAAVMQGFALHGFAPFRDEWLRHHAHQGRDVDVVLADARSIRGRVHGIADDGALLVEHGGGLEALHSGEVALRSAG